ncbi:hypothetical protein [Flindersiella endophytica]
MTTTPQTTTQTTTEPQTEWTLHEAAEHLVERLIVAACERSPGLAELAARLPALTSTRLFDWLDHLGGPVSADDLTAAGYVEGWRTVPGVWRHPGAQLPAIVPGPTWMTGLRVDDCAAFASAHPSTRGVQGAELSGFRQAVVIDDGVVVSGVERRSWAGGITSVEWAEDPVAESRRAWRLWAERPRTWGSSAEVLDLVRIAEEMVALVGPDLAASYALELERAYWQRRNTAAVLQHARQDRLGLGWGNNDHHTFRSSRVCFAPLIQVFRALGFAVRERFYAGADAGWGAQVMEHPGNGGVIFADVDLTPDEVAIDFAAEQLPPSDSLGTVGLWCALHGESVLVAGMHHLEGQFEFDQLRTDLTALGVGQLAPFSNFPHLRQAFTEAERWPVPRSRLEALVAAGELTAEKAEEFATRGAAGSHLENLARRAGFKGFNQANVSTTMRATDPRIL